MKKAIKILLFSLGLSSSLLSAQKNIDPKNMIGFGCYEDGMQTKQVHTFTLLLEKSNYKAFTKYLDSKNTAEKFLAAKVCERLNERKKLTLSSENIKKIKAIFNSNEIVSVCSGCTYFSKIPVSQLAQKSKENFMLENINFWLDENIL